jgi:Domain of unknown function (DUF4394)
VRSIRLPRRLAVVAAGLAVALVGTASAEAAQSKGGSGDLKAGNRQAVALTDQNQLVTFKVRNPDRLLSIRTIRGLQSGVNMVGIDYRPKTGDLYGVGSNSAVYRINPQTGIAIAENVDAMGNPVPFTPGLSGTNFGIDFNPAPDAIRVVSDAGQNKRVGPDSGATLGDDLALNPGMPKVGGAAYTNSSFSFTQPLAANVQLYVVDYANDMVFLQNPPNNGTLVNGQRLSGVDVQPKFGWDIAGTNDVGYLATSDRRGRASSLYTVDETTGSTRNLGQIGGRRLRGLNVTGLAVQQDQP